MKAAVFTEYGPPEVLHLSEVAEPPRQQEGVPEGPAAGEKRVAAWSYARLPAVVGFGSSYRRTCSEVCSRVSAREWSVGAVVASVASGQVHA